MGAFERRGVLLVLLLGGAACTLTRAEQDDCRSNAECRAAFGLGWVCGGDGLCAQAPPEPRCASTEPANLFRAEEPRIVLGTLVDGSLSTQVARGNAVRLAVMDANNAGGVEGRLFGLVTCDIRDDFEGDGRTRADAAVAMARYLEDVVGAPVVVGPPSSEEAERVLGETSQVVLISPSATSPALTALEPIPATDEAPGRLWRTAPTDEEQARQIVADLTGRGVTDAYALVQNGAYGDGLLTLLTELMPDLPSVRFSTSGQLSAAVDLVANEPARELLFISSNTEDTIDFLTAAVGDSRFDGRRFFLTDAAANQDLLAGLGALPTAQRDDLIARIRGTRPANDARLASAFASRYRIEFGQSNIDALSFTSHAYDAAWLALYGAVWSTFQEAEVTPLGVARGLRHVSAGVPVDVGELSWETVVETFRAGEGVDVTGASGALDYDPRTEERSEGGQSFEIWVVSPDGAQLCPATELACGT